MKVAVVAFLAVIGSVQGAQWENEIDLVDFAQMDIQAEFDSWRGAFGRDYSSITEEYTRFGVFISNMQRIAQFNTDGEHSSKVRANQFADWTRDEFTAYVKGGYQKPERKLPSIGLLGHRQEHVEANPASVDWTTQGVVTPVKNQGQCGSCWAFSATGSTECRWAIKTGTLNSLSEQQLVDCSRAEGNLGCNGGQMDAAFKYMEKNGGLCSESEYPYKGKDGSCEASSCGTKYNDISGYHDVTADSSSSLETAAAAGCVSVAIEADQTAFQYYSSGILDGNCGTNLDHGVLVVGYGSQSGKDYWKVKNSWGKTWGEQGYVLICKDCNKNGARGECGINMDPSYPTA